VGAFGTDLLPLLGLPLALPRLAEQAAWRRHTGAHGGLQTHEGGGGRNAKEGGG